MANGANPSSSNSVTIFLFDNSYYGSRLTLASSHALSSNALALYALCGQ